MKYAENRYDNPTIRAANWLIRQKDTAEIVDNVREEVKAENPYADYDDECVVLPTIRELASRLASYADDLVTRINDLVHFEFDTEDADVDEADAEFVADALWAQLKQVNWTHVAELALKHAPVAA